MNDTLIKQLQDQAMPLQNTGIERRMMDGGQGLSDEQPAGGMGEGEDLIWWCWGWGYGRGMPLRV